MPFAIRQPSILIPKGLGCATEGSRHPSCGWCGCHDPAPKKKRLEARSWQTSLDNNNKECCNERASSLVLCRWRLQREERLSPSWCQRCVVVVKCVAGSYFIWVRCDICRFCTRATIIRRRVKPAVTDRIPWSRSYRVPRPVRDMATTTSVPSMTLDWRMTDERL